MSRRAARAVAAWGMLSVCAVMVTTICSCALAPNRGLLDPTKVGRFSLGKDAHETEIRRILSPRETPPGVANATEPTPEDMVPIYTEYRITAGDIVQISIPDLTGGTTPYSVVNEVSALGDVRIPELDQSVRIAGLTEQEAEREIKDRLVAAQLLTRPLVFLTLQQKRGNIFHILGPVRTPGPYPIPNPDLTVTEALAMAGDADPSSKKAYIIRQPRANVLPAPSPRDSGAQPRTPPPPTEELIIPPPVEPPPTPAVFRTAGSAQEEPPTAQDIRDIMTPPTTRAAPGKRESDLPTLIFDPETSQVINTKPTTTPTQPPPDTRVAPPPPVTREEPFNWEAFEDIADEQRVIEINLDAVRTGSEQGKVIIRQRDVISIPSDTGVFYLMGEINRPGVYAFGGRDITVKQALAIAGGPSALAWPQTCELIRKERGTDRQITIAVNLDAIYAGLEPDFYLKDDDILNVGSHAIAPFLFVLRNSFRLTYGFGFVYDRNFADVDAYNARANPETIQQARKATRGLPF
jgi:polysaccharide biosynthesis/export protein